MFEHFVLFSWGKDHFLKNKEKIYILIIKNKLHHLNHLKINKSFLSKNHLKMSYKTLDLNICVSKMVSKELKQNQMHQHTNILIFFFKEKKIVLIVYNKIVKEIFFFFCTCSN